MNDVARPSGFCQPTNVMRILHLNSLLTGGGTDDQCVKLAHGLQQLGHQVWIAGPDGREFSQVIRNLGVPFHATRPEGPLKWRFIFDVARFIRREKFQIVHSHHGRDYWPTVLAARLAGTRPKIVFSRHLAKSPSSWPSRHFLLSQCDAMIAVSSFVAKVLREGAYEPESPEPERHARPPLRGDHSKIHVIQNGIDTERFHPFDVGDLRRQWSLAPEHFVFAVVGGYGKPRGKGQREFLAAAASIHEEFPNARFLIVGRGNLADTLKADIARLGLTGKAWLTPYCTDMPAAMNAIDCLVHPQIGTEAFPGVTLEALACGKPVIASQLDGIPEQFLAREHGLLVPPENIASLAAALRYIASDPERARQMGAAGRVHICRHFDVRLQVEKTVALYLQLCGQTADATQTK
ncbi:MAG: glycosyltransferase family 4 protein [Verrucomicrobia bacterium]|nr:glycosyltransferase family 4 protein [Verrucomicrobiota bacterium]